METYDHEVHISFLRGCEDNRLLQYPQVNLEVFKSFSDNYNPCSGHISRMFYVGWRSVIPTYIQVNGERLEYDWGLVTKDCCFCPRQLPCSCRLPCCGQLVLGSSCSDCRAAGPGDCCERAGVASWTRHQFWTWSGDGWFSVPKDLSAHGDNRG